MHAAILIIGSNIQPEKNIDRVLDLLRERITLVELSSIWQTEPVGTVGPYFLNLAARVITELEAESLKWSVLREIEEQMGRVRTADKYAPRPIDLDIVLFDGEVLDNGLWERGYIALTVAELEPGLIHPLTGERLDEVAKRLRRTYDAVQWKDQPDR